MEVKHKVATGVVGWFLRTTGNKAITLGHTIHYLDEDCMANKCLRLHELCHIRQIEDVGMFMFYLTYPFKRSEYEKECYKVQEDCIKGL